MPELHDAQREEEAFFDQYFPAGTSQKSTGYKMDIDDRLTKQQRLEQDTHKGGGYRDKGKGRAGQGPGQREGGGGRGRERQDRRSRLRSNKDDDDSASDLRSAITSLQRLVLRHEDSISMIQSEYSFVTFLRIGSASSVVPALYDAQRAWRQLRDSDPGKVTKPMRCTLLACLLKELSARLKNLTNEAENKASLHKLGWLNEDYSAWAYLQWSVEKRKLVADDSKTSLTVSEAECLVDKLRELVAEPGLVVRFHPTRPISDQMTGESLTCCLQVSIREPRAAILHERLSTLSGSACAQLIGMGLRKDRMGRSALAQAIAKTM